MADIYEHGKKPSGYIKTANFLTSYRMILYFGVL
jgi:hypothetical protein